MKPELQLIDGWLTDDPREYAHFTQEKRTGSVGSLLQMDLRSPKMWAMWLAGGGALVIGLATSRNDLALVGAAVLSWYLSLLWKMSRPTPHFRLVPLTLRFAPAEPTSEMWVAEFLEPETNTHARAVCPAWAVERFKAPDGTLHVLVAFDRTAMSQPVIGIKPGYTGAE